MILTTANGTREHGNFSATSLCDLPLRPSRCNRDFTVVTREPPIVRFFQAVFENDLKQKKYDLLALIQAFCMGTRTTVSPHSLEPFLKFIQSAKVSIQLHNQYLKDIIK